MLALQTSYRHHTWNDGDSERIILYFDTWHPELTEAERQALRVFIDERRRFLGNDGT